jgi:hypothetical protein
MTKRMRIPPRLLVALLVAYAAIPAYAGFWALPIEAELDLADRIVAGKIIKIDPIQGDQAGNMRMGRATIAVDETLKGAKADTIEATVVVHLDHGDGMQSPPRIYNKGNSGIWVIMPDGRPSHGYGLLVVNRLREVKDHLAMLEKREWSTPVGGIQVWVGGTDSQPGHAARQAVLFAVKNVGKESIYLPRSLYSGIVTVVAQHEDGRQYELRGAGDQCEMRTEMVCEPLEPGRTRYMHWDGEDYGAFQFPKDALHGRYTVRGVLATDRKEGVTRGRDRRSVQVWTGRVASDSTMILARERQPEPSVGGDGKPAPQP